VIRCGKGKGRLSRGSTTGRAKACRRPHYTMVIEFTCLLPTMRDTSMITAVALTHAPLPRADPCASGRRRRPRHLARERVHALPHAQVAVVAAGRAIRAIVPAPGRACRSLLRRVTAAVPAPWSTQQSNAGRQHAECCSALARRTASAGRSAGVVAALAGLDSTVRV